jgi:HlyD family secretion protein
MKNIYTKIKKSGHHILKHKIISIIIILALCALGWYIYKNSSENIKYDTITANRGSVSEIVSVTGNVKPLSDVNLAFEQGGKVDNILVSVGDKVYVGQPLISVSNTDLTANLNQAQANAKKALAQYQDIKIGTRAEEITLQETQVENATLDLAQAKASLINSLKDSYTKADDAVRNKMYSLFINPIKYGAKLSFATDSSLQDSIEKGKDTINDTLDTWYLSLAKLDNTSDLDAYYDTAKTNLSSIKVLLDDCATAVNLLSPDSSSVTQTQIDTWKLNISTARTNIDLAISSLAGNYDAYKTGVSTLKISQDQLALKKAGSTSGTILGAEASYEAAQAGVLSAEAELAKSIIKSPIDGIVTNIDVKLGEIVPAGKDIVSVISYGQYEVEAFVPEADIAKIKIGNEATSTLDAYGSNVFFDTSVIKIDPAATVIDGVPTYKVTLKFNNQDERVKSGMTANLDILSNKKDNVVVIPNRVISTNTDGSKYITVINGNDTSETINKNIVTGIRGYDGNVEVVSGLNDGDIVVVPTL